MLFQKKKEVPPEVFTEQACNSCGNMDTRPFEEGDSVFAKGKPCTKCSSDNTLIESVYGVYPPDEKKA